MPRKPKASDLDRDSEGRYSPPDPRLIEFGREIGSVYEQLLEARYGVRQRVPAGKAWILYRAAELATSLGLTADEFVTRQLAQMAIQGTFWPQALMSWTTAEKASQTSQAGDASQHARYIAQLLLARQLEPLYGPSIYRDPMWPFSPLIRHVLAQRAGDQDYVKVLSDAVRLEAAQHPAARSLLGLL